MIIGLCGYKGSGKSEVSKYLAEYHKFTPINFKDSLVEEMKRLLPRTLESLVASNQDIKDIDDLFKVKPPTMRCLMQEFGTEIFRGFNENYWIDKWENKIWDAFSKKQKRVVVDDVRFTNECLALKGFGGVLVRVVVVGKENTTDTHQSEKEQEGFNVDFTITANYGNIDGLHRQVESILDTISAD